MFIELKGWYSFFWESLRRFKCIMILIVFWINGLCWVILKGCKVNYKFLMVVFYSMGNLKKKLFIDGSKI